MIINSNVTLYEFDMLKDVVDLYIQTGQPVSSRVLKAVYRLNVSTAKIRNILHRLEERGYLFKPHVSSGRIPSDLGYRVYVDGIKAYNPLSRRLTDEIERKIGQDWNDIRDVMSRTSRLLGELTNYMGLIMGVFHSSSIVERLRIIQLERNRGLVVLTLVPDRERRVYVAFPKRYQSNILDRAEQIINERIAGHPLERAPERLESFLRESAGIEREIAEIVTAEAEYLFDWPYDLKYYFKGFEHSTEIPELTDSRTLQRLVKFMGERALMLRVMKNRLGHELMVTIGRENEVEELADFSIVTQSFTTSDCGGLIGILGPTRMAYSRILSLLKRMAEELHHVQIKD